MRFGILGGTFNPVHFGHLRIAEEIRERSRLDKIIFIPSGNPPLKAVDLADISHRYEMTRLATDSNANFIVSDIEAAQTGKSYTVNTVRQLLGMYPGDDLFLVLGIDAFLDMPNWWMPDILTTMIDFIVVPRPGFNHADICRSPYLLQPHGQAELSGLRPLKMISGRSVTIVPVTQLNISSTGIRGLVQGAESIKYLLPEVVETYIHEHKLYG